MLTNYTIENFKSFRDIVEFDLKANNETNLSEWVSQEGVLRAIGMFGENGAGKSTSIKAIAVLIELLVEELDIMGIVPHILGKIYMDEDGETRVNIGMKTHLVYEFLFDHKTVVYSVVFDTDKNIIEAEHVLINDKPIFERHHDEINGKKVNSVKPDRSHFRVAYHNGSFDEIEDSAVVTAFMDFLANSAYIDNARNQILTSENDHTLNKFLRDEKNTDRLNSILRRLNNQFQASLLSEGSIGSEPQVYVTYKDRFPIPFTFESVGNKATLKLIPWILRIIDKPGMLLIDEMDFSLHFETFKVILELVKSEATSSQLFFTCHKLDIMHPSVLRADQIYLVRRDEDLVSQVAKVSSFKPRSTQNYQKMYKSGRFGYLPSFIEKVKQYDA